MNEGCTVVSGTVLDSGMGGGNACFQTTHVMKDTGRMTRRMEKDVLLKPIMKSMMATGKTT